MGEIWRDAPRGGWDFIYRHCVAQTGRKCVEVIKEVFLCGPNYSLYERHLCALFIRNLIFNVGTFFVEIDTE